MNRFPPLLAFEKAPVESWPKVSSPVDEFLVTNPESTSGLSPKPAQNLRSPVITNQNNGLRVKLGSGQSPYNTSQAQYFAGIVSSF